MYNPTIRTNWLDASANGRTLTLKERSFYDPYRLIVKHTPVKNVPNTLMTVIGTGAMQRLFKGFPPYV